MNSVKYIAGIDVGNSTTEIALVQMEQGKPVTWWSACVPTTGVKGKIGRAHV